MRQAGRKSAAQLSVVRIPGQRYEPPSDLTPDQASIWRQVIATKPAEWFSVDSHPLLAAYCRHTATANWLAERINAIEAGRESTDEMDYKSLLAMRNTETTALMKLATTMRVSQQSRYKSETAATKAANAGDSNKPWLQNA